MTQPMLHEESEEHPIWPESEGTPLLRTDSAEDPRDKLRPRVVALCFVVMFFFELGACLWLPAANAMLERRICHDVYSGVIDTALLSGDVDSPCKSTAVQGKLAMLRGWQSSIDCIPGLLTIVPYGILSDTWGRKRVLALANFGVLLMLGFQIAIFHFDNIFPIEAVLFSGVFMLIGGSASVSAAMIFTLLADVVPAASIATVFFRFAAFGICAEITSGPLAGLLLLKGVWTGLIVSYALLSMTSLVVFAFPETLELHKLAAEEGGEDVNSSSVLRRSVRQVRQGAGQFWKFICADLRITILIVSLVFVVLSKFVQELLLQYTAKRYHWTWSQASFVLTIRSLSNLTMFLVVLPALGRFFTKKLKMPVLIKDLWIARITGSGTIIGALLIAFAVKTWILSIGLVFFAMSGGMSLIIRSLLNSLVEQHHIGMLNSAIGLAEIISMIVAAPTISKTLRVGLEWGGLWIGLPFMLAAGIVSISTSIVWLYRLPPTATEREHERSD